jgi:abhydrolase domain-containing protein 6
MSIYTAPRRKPVRDFLVGRLFALQYKLSRLARKTAHVDGHTWHYLEGGPARAEQTVLLVHGFGASKDTWAPMCHELTQTYRVIAPDLPGFGDSARNPALNYALPAQRERLRAFARALGVNRMHIVGSSMGGHLAALYTHAHPEQVRSLALFANAGVTALRNNEMTDAVQRGENPLLSQSVADFDRVLEFVAHKLPPMPGFVKRYLAERAFADRDFNAAIFAQYIDDVARGLESLLPQIDVPTLVLWGRQDRVLDVSCVDVMRPLLRRAQAVVMEQTGHIPMVERPVHTARHLRAFLESL